MYIIYDPVRVVDLFSKLALRQIKGLTIFHSNMGKF